MSELLTLHDFADWVNQEFQIQFTPEVTLPAILTEAVETKGHSVGDRKPFSLTFRTAQKTEYYPQGIFRLLHPEKGEIYLFLSPLGPDAEGMRYEAAFS